MFTTADERQLLNSRITHIDGDVPKTLADPPQRHRRRVTIAAPGEVEHECGGDDELEECTTSNRDYLTEWAEHEVSRLMDRQVNSIQKAAPFRVTHQWNRIQRQRDREREAGIGGGGTRLVVLRHVERWRGHASWTVIASCRQRSYELTVSPEQRRYARSADAVFLTPVSLFLKSRCEPGHAQRAFCVAVPSYARAAC